MTARPWNVEIYTNPLYDLKRGQPGSIADHQAAMAEKPITYDWKNGFAIVRYRGRIIGMAAERGDVYSLSLKLGDQKIDKTGLDGLKALWLFVELWVSSVTVEAAAQ